MILCIHLLLLLVSASQNVLSRPLSSIDHKPEEITGCDGNVIINGIFGFRYKNYPFIVYQAFNGSKLRTLVKAVFKSNDFNQRPSTLRTEKEIRNAFENRIKEETIVAVTQALSWISVKCSGQYIYTFNETDITEPGRQDFAKQFADKEFPSLLSSVGKDFVLILTHDNSNENRVSNKGHEVSISHGKQFWYNKPLRKEEGHTYDKNETLVRIIKSCHNFVILNMTDDYINLLLITKTLMYQAVIFRTNNTISLDAAEPSTNLLLPCEGPYLHSRIEKGVLKESIYSRKDTSNYVNDLDFKTKARNVDQFESFSQSIDTPEVSESGVGWQVMVFLSGLVCGDPEPNPYICRKEKKWNGPDTFSFSTSLGESKQSDDSTDQVRTVVANAITSLIIVVIFLLVIIHITYTFRRKLKTILWLRRDFYKVQGRWSRRERIGNVFVRSMRSNSDDLNDHKYAEFRDDLELSLSCQETIKDTDGPSTTRRKKRFKKRMDGLKTASEERPITATPSTPLLIQSKSKG